MTNESGPRWARGGLIFGVAASIGGNVANACLTQSAASTPLRIVLAVIWPISLFLGVEVLVRNRNVSGWLARVGQFGLLTVSVPTAVTSYVNLHALMIKASEPGIAQMSGPIAIDGLMLGCTIMLLATRAAALALPAAPAEVAATQPIDPSFDEEWDIREIAPALPVPVSPAAPRKPRAKWDARRVCELAVDGTSATVANELTSVGKSTYDRYARVARILKQDPRAEIGAELKVPADHVTTIRELVSKP